jgi:hypothetical protein
VEKITVAGNKPDSIGIVKHLYRIAGEEVHPPPPILGAWCKRFNKTVSAEITDRHGLARSVPITEIFVIRTKCIKMKV